MLTPSLRSLLSAVLAVCFAQSAMAWGRMPECAGPAGGSPSAHHASSHGDHASGAPSREHRGRTPANQACVVHLCCAHLAPQAPVTLGAARLSDARANAGLVAVSANVVLRPAHSLPFAHAPPHPIV